MACLARCVLCVFFALTIAGLGCEATCTQAEFTDITNCIAPHILTFASVITGNTCDRNQISSDLCSRYATIVTCINTADVSDKTCRPLMVTEIDKSVILVACKVNDYRTECRDAPKLNEGSSGSTTKATVSMLAVSLMTTFILLVLS